MSTWDSRLEFDPYNIPGAAPLAGPDPGGAVPGRFLDEADLTHRLPLAKIMIVDDESVNIRVARKFLEDAGHVNFVTTTASDQAIPLMCREKPDVVLLDIMMPGVSGLDILRQIQELPSEERSPVIVLTAGGDDVQQSAFDLGAKDFLSKPINRPELVSRVRNTLLVKLHSDHLRRYNDNLATIIHERTRELAASRLELIHCLARAAEYRDNETGRHVLRVGRYAGVLARGMALDESFCELIELAAPLHDMGKIGVPDHILLKPGPLDPEEFAIMKRHSLLGKRTFEPVSQEEWNTLRSHTFLGVEILSAGCSLLLATAARIALTHHERWDGTGYPVGLSGEDIPIEGRIVAVADVFDALSSERPYKPAVPIDECCRIVEEGAGTHFDPKVVEVFVARRAELVEIRMQYADAD